MVEKEKQEKMFNWEVEEGRGKERREKEKIEEIKKQKQSFCKEGREEG